MIFFFHLRFETLQNLINCVQLVYYINSVLADLCSIALIHISFYPFHHHPIFIYNLSRQLQRKSKNLEYKNIQKLLYFYFKEEKYYLLEPWGMPSVVWILQWSTDHLMSNFVFPALLWMGGTWGTYFVCSSPTHPWWVFLKMNSWWFIRTVKYLYVLYIWKLTY